MSSEPFAEREQTHSHPHPHHPHSSHFEPQPHIAMFQIINGMWVSQVASAIAQLGVADAIAAGTHDADAIADAASANRDALYRLLRAGATIGLLTETSPKHFALTPVGATLCTDAPNSLRELLIAETAPGHWLPWGRLTDAVREGRSLAQDALGTDVWSYYANNPDEMRCFARGMSNVSTIASADVARVYDPGPVERIVDVGGSEGAMLRGLLQRVSGARGVLFDRPETIETAKSVIAASGMAERIDLVPGDFLSEVPEGGDLYVLKSILHDWPDEKCEAIVRNVHRAAAANSRLLVVEMLLPDSPQPTPVTLMDINMLVMLSGRERTAADFAALLGRCGYTIERVIPTEGLFNVIEARRV